MDTGSLHSLLHHSVDDAAERHSSKDAFRYAGDGLTYGELRRRANQLAHLLIQRGVGPHDRVGIFMHKCLDLPVALYGILKAGGAYVPIDPTAPVERVRFMVEDCGIHHLVIDAAHRRKASQVASQVDDLETIVGAAAEDAHAEFIPWEEIHDQLDRDPAVPVLEHDLAYIMYTSGSTGVPKGLMHTHHSGMAYARLSAREYGVTADDRLGNHSPLHFDMSTFEYLTGPLVGATTVIIPEEVTLFPRSLAQLIDDERLTFWYSVPLALIQLLERGDLDEHDGGSLRWVLFGGEPFAPKHLNRLAEHWPKTRFSNSYGPAEVNQCTAYHLPRGPLDEDTPVPIGPVWSGAQGLVLDSDDHEVAPGEVGELVIRSATMMRGYWGRADLNEKAFHRRSAFAGFEEVFYRTGDLVRDRGDGHLVFLGRKDRLVKVRGYRVELDEVEAVLCAVPEVAEVGVVDLRQDNGEATLAAAVLPREGAEITESALRRAAAKKLPVYAVPSVIEVRSELPRTGSGKVNRKALQRDFARPQQTARVAVGDSS